MISVIIPTFHRPGTLSACLASLLPHENKFEELIVVATGPWGESVNADCEQLLQAFRLMGTRVETCDMATGGVHGRMLGTNLAEFEFLLFLDDDAVVGRGYFDLMKHFEDKNVAMVSGALQTPINPGYKVWGDSPLLTVGPFCNTLDYDKKTRHLTLGNRWQVFRHNERKVFKTCQYLNGTAFFIRRVWTLWDLKYQTETGSSGEDIDLSYGLFHNGHKLVFDSGAVAWHLHQAKGGERDKEKIKCKCNLDNFSCLVSKYGIGDRVDSMEECYSVTDKFNLE